MFEEVFHTQDIHLHEETFTENFGEKLTSIKNLKVEGIQLTDKTKYMFENLQDQLFESLDTLSLAFTTDEEGQ